MSPVDDRPPPGAENDADRLDGLLTDQAMSLDLVSALAGDRQLTEAEGLHLDDFKKDRGNRFYSDLLYAVTHQYYPPETAEELWNHILRHKYEMSAAMRRNIRITVASLDYLSNLTHTLPSATLISEAHIADIIRLAQLDGLTGLFNHACCFQKMDMELHRFARYGTPVSLMMIDIDNFKAINDRHGHQTGDKVLAMAGKTIRETARESDICCRYGGEEFAVILPSTGAQEAGALAERLRAKVALVRPGGRAITISIGVAASGEKVRTAQELVSKADAALYQAKLAGKDRVMVSA